MYCTSGYDFQSRDSGFPGELQWEINAGKRPIIVDRNTVKAFVPRNTIDSANCFVLVGKSNQAVNYKLHRWATSLCRPDIVKVG